MTKSLSKFNDLWRLSSVCFIAIAIVIARWSFAAPPGHFQATFDSDPQWDAFRNRILPKDLPQVRQDFGFRTTNYAGGKAAGEIGGTINRAQKRAGYAMPIKPRTLEQELSASGTFAVTRAGGSSAAMIGWFNAAKSQGWRTPNSLMVRIDGNGGKYWVFFEYGTSEYSAGGGAAFEGERYQTTPTPPFPADGTVHEWSLEYDPKGADGQGLMTFRIDGREYKAPLVDGHKLQGATFDRFGIMNQQTAGDSLDLFVDDLEVDGELVSLDRDPGWEGDDNRVSYEQRVLRPYHDIGFSNTSHAGGERGEIGGIMFRDEAPMFYADKVGPFSLNDELKASGRIAMTSAGADSALAFGWFNGEGKRNKKTPDYEERQTDYLAVILEGPSRIGHYFRAGYSTAKGRGDAPTNEGLPDERPVIRPDGAVHWWSLDYDPNGASGRGRITTVFDGERHVLDLKDGERAEGAKFDRFGFFNTQAGGHHVEAYLDDLTYSKGDANSRE